VNAAINAGQKGAGIVPPKAKPTPSTGTTLERLPLDSIKPDPKLNLRAKLDDSVAQEYALAFEDGAKPQFPPVTVFRDSAGVLYLADGHHRHRAHVIAGQKDILAEIKPGSERDALEWAISANATNGLRRTNACKRKSVLALLGDPEWSKLTQRELAAKACVDHVTVGNIKRELIASGEIHQDETKGKARKNSKRKKTKSFDAARASKAVRKDLDRIAKNWSGETIESLIETVQNWIVERSANAPKVA
jgi:ParB-like nuclease family protein